MIPLSPGLPDITKTQPVRAFRVGQYLALLVENPKSLADAGGNGSELIIKYLYALAFIRTGKPADLVLIVTSELSGPALTLMFEKTTGIEHRGNPFLCIFDGSGVHANLGDSPDWAHRDRFTAKALEIGRERLQIREAPIELKAKADGMSGIWTGLLLLGLGGIITGATYSAASLGGPFIVTTGLFFVGGLVLLKGLWRSFISS